MALSNRNEHYSRGELLSMKCFRRIPLSAYCGYLLMTSLSGIELRAEEISVLYVGVADTSAHFGARQGLSEAVVQGEFMGIEYRMLTAAEMDQENVSPVAIIAAVEPTRLIQLVEAYPNLAIFNITANDTKLRELCRDNLFHIGPSAAMLADAEAQWRRHAPDSAARARAWHRTFQKYAAAQLNIRFKKQFATDMDDDAWAGWAAMKLLADTLVRQPSLGGADLIEALKTNQAFDGQKGADLSFRETGQLRQPVLLVEQDKIVGEAPVRGVADTSDLDSLGLAFCPK